MPRKRKDRSNTPEYRKGYENIKWDKEWPVLVAPDGEPVYFDGITVRQVELDGSLGPNILTDEDYEDWVG